MEKVEVFVKTVYFWICFQHESLPSYVRGDSNLKKERTLGRSSPACKLGHAVIHQPGIGSSDIPPFAEVLRGSSLVFFFRFL